ncbi:MAG TPA: hypothetical protein VJS39_05435 [Gemmatimonadaceae bacterium]|nr:hypothetical protein [Gemmatimonadaceae bacterium]
MRSGLLVLLMVAVAGCSSSTDPLLVNGKWVQDFSFPGSSFEMSLRDDGTQVSGSGDWCGEAGPCGTVSVTGTSTATGVELDLHYSFTGPIVGDGGISHFSGRLTSDGKLRGSIRSGGLPSAIAYHRG